MAGRKGDALRRGTLHLEEIAPDASWLDHIERVREGGRRYRPASQSNRPSLSERPATPCKVRRPDQLKLDLRAAHRAVLAAQSADQRALMSVVGYCSRQIP